MNDLVESGVYGQTEANRMCSLAASIPGRETPQLESGPRVGQTGAGIGPDPFDLLIAMSAPTGEARTTVARAPFRG